MSFAPDSPEALQEFVRKNSAVYPRGGGSKPALACADDAVTVIDMRGLSGIIEYEPGEYTFTAYAGTPIADITAALAENGQYMPFDPLLVQAGTTLGGTVAANTSGSGRYRYGGIRDFILGVRFVDGQGRLVRSGGKVVKNSAGFDLSKFFVGSMGQYGILVDISMKVFPQPPAYRTLRVCYADIQTAMDSVFKLATRPFDIDALDIEPSSKDCVVLLRISGPADALPDRIERLKDFYTNNTDPLNLEIVADDAALWAAVNACSWAQDYAEFVKVPVKPRLVAHFDETLAVHGVKRRYSCGGNVAWLAAKARHEIGAPIRGLSLVGLRLSGKPGDAIIGQIPGAALAQRMKKVLDPEGKFTEKHLHEA